MKLLPINKSKESAIINKCEEKMQLRASIPLSDYKEVQFIRNQIAVSGC
jgi:hypothetical protein